MELILRLSPLWRMYTSTATTRGCVAPAVLYRVIDHLDTRVHGRLAPILLGGRPTILRAPTVQGLHRCRSS